MPDTQSSHEGTMLRIQYWLNNFFIDVVDAKLNRVVDASKGKSMSGKKHGKKKRERSGRRDKAPWDIREGEKRSGRGIKRNAK